MAAGSLEQHPFIITKIFVKYKFLQLKFVLTIGNNDPVLASLERPKEVPPNRLVGAFIILFKSRFQRQCLVRCLRSSSVVG
jgi:hypothetical protein